MMDDRRLRNGADQQDRYAKIWRFQLTGALAVGSSATAKRLDWDGTELELSTDTLEVWSFQEGHKAASGTQGYCIFMPDARRWEVVSLLGSFGRIKGTLVGAMTSGDATHTIDNIVVLSGADPRTDPTSTTEAVTVNNTDHTMAGDDNAYARAEWNPASERWEFYQVTCPA